MYRMSRKTADNRNVAGQIVVAFFVELLPLAVSELEFSLIISVINKNKIVME